MPSSTSVGAKTDSELVVGIEFSPRRTTAIHMGMRLRCCHNVFSSMGEHVTFSIIFWMIHVLNGQNVFLLVGLGDVLQYIFDLALILTTKGDQTIAAIWSCRGTFLILSRAPRRAVDFWYLLINCMKFLNSNISSAEAMTSHLRNTLRLRWS